MELFQELLITLAVSLLVSFLVAKLFSMASPCDACVTAEVEEAVFCEQKPEEKSVVWEEESERSVHFVGEAVRFSGRGEEESRAEKTIGSPLAFGDDEFIQNEEVLEEVAGVGLGNKVSEGSIFVEAAKGGLLKDGVGFEEQLFDDSPKRGELYEIGIESEDFIGMSPETAKFRKIEIESDKDEEVRVLESEPSKGNESEGVESKGNDGGEEGFFDDWEGIERTELEKRFGAAVVFVGSKSNADLVSGLDSDTKTQLQGLHKVATEGPCHVPSPMALKVSARAKWNAWQQLGDMSQEVAMEQYITLLSKSIPGWMVDDAKEKD